MAIINEINEVLHRIRVKLYPNYLSNVEGQYIARTDSEASLSIEQVCAALKNRGGFTGRYDELVDYVKEFFDETAYQLCDGFAVNMKYFSVHPNVGGTFNNSTEIHDHKKHPISFRFRSGLSLRKLIPNIAVDIEGIADTAGWIDEFIDVENDSINSLFEAGNQFILHGHKIKASGDDPAVGVYIVPVDDPSKAVKVARIAENSPSKIIGIIPQATGFSSNRVEIRTQYSSGPNLLKAPPRHCQQLHPGTCVIRPSTRPGGDRRQGWAMIVDKAAQRCQATKGKKTSHGDAAAQRTRRETKDLRATPGTWHLAINKGVIVSAVGGVVKRHSRFTLKGLSKKYRQSSIIFYHFNHRMI